MLTAGNLLFKIYKPFLNEEAQYIMKKYLKSYTVKCTIFVRETQKGINHS